MTSRRQARAARGRARYRAALAHPAAAARYRYRAELRRVVSVSVWAVRRGCSAAEMLGAFVLHVMAKFGFSLPPAPRPRRPSLAELAALAAEATAALAAIVAALAVHLAAVSRVRDTAETRTESAPCRAPGQVRIPARTHVGHVM